MESSIPSASFGTPQIGQTPGPDRMNDVTYGRIINTLVKNSIPEFEGKANFTSNDVKRFIFQRYGLEIGGDTIKPILANSLRDGLLTENIDGQYKVAAAKGKKKSAKAAGKKSASKKPKKKSAGKKKSAKKSGGAKKASKGKKKSKKKGAAPPEIA